MRSDTMRNTSRKHAAIFSFSIMHSRIVVACDCVCVCEWVTRESHGGNSWHGIELNPFLQLVYFLVLSFVLSFESFDSLRGWPVFITTSHSTTLYRTMFIFFSPQKRQYNREAKKKHQTKRQWTLQWQKCSIISKCVLFDIEVFWWIQYYGLYLDDVCFPSFFPLLFATDESISAKQWKRASIREKYNNNNNIVYITNSTCVRLVCGFLCDR